MMARSPDHIPRNLNIAFLGDSVTRYLYVSLAYFLTTGTWIHPDWSRLPYNPTTAGLFPAGDRYNAYFEYANQLLGQNEFCDCNRGAFESHYFYEPNRNNRLAMFMRGGTVPHIAPFLGRVKSSTVWKNFTNLQGIPFGFQDDRPTPEAWQHYDWVDFIRQELGTMDPRPDMVVLNAGLWKSTGFDEAYAHNVSQALQDIGIRPEHAFWRTTTYIIPNHIAGNTTQHAFVGNREVDERMCRILGGTCIDMEFTSQWHRDQFSDYRHFFEPGNRIMNEEILQTLGVLPRGYKRFLKEHATRPISALKNVFTQKELRFSAVPTGNGTIVNGKSLQLTIK